MKLKTLIDKIHCPYILYQDKLIPREYNNNYLEEKVISVDWWREKQKLIIYLKVKE